MRRVKTPHRFFPVFQQLLRHPRLVAVLQDLLGPSLRLTGSKINLKSPRYGSPVEWHQDWAFYPHTNDDLLAVGVMLDDCTQRQRPAHGGAGQSPRSHIRSPCRRVFLRSHRSRRPFSDEIARAVPLTGRAGSMSFHHVRLVHGSAQNVSSLPRTPAPLRVRRRRRVAAHAASPILPTSTRAS